jgi:hypothetical protein
MGENDITINLKSNRMGVYGLIHLSPVRHEWRALVNVAMNLRVSEKIYIFSEMIGSLCTACHYRPDLLLPAHVASETMKAQLPANSCGILPFHH